MVLNGFLYEDTTTYIIYEYPSFMATFAAFFGGKRSSTFLTAQ